MRREELADLGGFVAEQPVEKEVSWVRADGERVTFTVLIRQLPWIEYEAIAPDGSSNIERMCHLLARTVMLDSDDGPALLGYEDARRLNQGLVLELAEAVQEVNGAGKP